jgi:dihydroorotate dehydrogenase electron transfer subunit
VKKFLEMATIVENEAIIPEVWKMVFHAPQIAREAQPGQFVNVHRDGGQTFLRRPFGIVDADAETGHVTIIYRLVGKGTEEMKGLRSGDALSVEGPPGRRRLYDNAGPGPAGRRRCRPGSAHLFG